MNEQISYVEISDANGAIRISTDVLAELCAAACLETNGVSAMGTAPQTTPIKGVSVDLETDGTCTVDAYVLVRMGDVLTDVAKTAQLNVKTAIDAVAGVSLGKVNIYVAGVVMK
ncbi:MAG: Asp23/Gls24 family envelope stress response protein [Clostridiaceae bacterium]|nr:Asp23/Gls24 family envelope stress response protein [Clostridiaceae bacterium]